MNQDEKNSLNSIGIDKWLIDNLNEINITHLFPVQREIVPFIIQTEGHDICVCAPTGSGKTLAYAIPIVQKIAKTRVIRRVRVVVIVPTHDLVLQVEKTFQSILRDTDLVVESLGVKPFHIEQKLLVKNNSYGDTAFYESLVDIIVSTPGRLVDHINETPGFTLKYLNYLVIDEADRLLRQSFQDWLEIVMESTGSTNNNNSDNNIDLSNNNSNIEFKDNGEINIIENNKYISKEISPSNHLSWNQFKLVKLLLSATMTYNPSKISLLQLNAPLFFTTTKIKEIKYSMPSTLKESYVITNAEQRPLVLLNIIKETLLSNLKSNTRKKMICFTKSVDITHRLNILLKLIGQVDSMKFVSEEYSSALTTTERSDLLNRFTNGEIDILICSDIMSRGMDISDIDVVINYNTPPNITLYVHRVGRTARAGKEGYSYTIVEKQEITYYISMMKKAERSQTLHSLKWKPNVYAPYESSYKLALNQMRLIYSKRKDFNEEDKVNDDNDKDNDHDTDNQHEKQDSNNSSLKSRKENQDFEINNEKIKLKQSILEVCKKRAKKNFNF
ncbi:hypothetical protein CYY_003882 [Polysphondylium violaceum]|uniref:RNA helicase n=1 Tax=Polysphondylium violaceum TaxID=133409 RepID=A0A8J4V0T6_9MYCE|nr:hypothetical protein CYY_003882 [Polysphondylium violaceum]